MEIHHIKRLKGNSYTWHVFFAFLYKGNNFCDFLLSCNHYYFWKGHYTRMKEFGPNGQILNFQSGPDMTRKSIHSEKVTSPVCMTDTIIICGCQCKCWGWDSTLCLLYIHAVSLNLIITYLLIFHLCLSKHSEYICYPTIGDPDFTTIQVPCFTIFRQCCSCLNRCCITATVKQSVKHSYLKVSG